MPEFVIDYFTALWAMKWLIGFVAVVVTGAFSYEALLLPRAGAR